MIFESRRFRFRPLQEPDKEDFCAIYMSEKVMQHMRKPMSAKTAQKQFQRELEMAKQDKPDLQSWSVRKASNQDFAGVGYLIWQGHPPGCAEIGLLLAEIHLGKGFAIEIVQSMLAYLKTREDVTSIISRTDKDNTAAQRVLIRCGFTDTQKIVDGPYGKCLLFDYKPNNQTQQSDR